MSATVPQVPEDCWRGPFALYREVMGPTTEASDNFHFVCFFAAVGLAIGRSRFAYNAGRVYPNVQAVLIGESASDHKSTSMTRATDVACGALWHPDRAPYGVQMLSGIASGEGLLDALAGRHGKRSRPDTFPRQRVLLKLDEFAGLLAKAKQKGRENLIPLINEAYDMRERIQLPSRSNAIVAEESFLAVLAGSTREWLEKRLNEDDIHGGFANRYLFACGGPKPPMPSPPKPDPHGLAQLRDVLSRIEGDSTVTPLAPREMPVSSAARAVWDRFYIDWHGRRWSSLVGIVVKRIPDYVMRLALVYAVLEGTEEITGEQMEAAVAFGWWAADSAASVFDVFTADRIARIEQRITKYIRERGDVKKRDVKHYLGGSVSSLDFNRIWDAMVVAGELVPVQCNGKPRFRFAGSEEAMEVSCG